MKIRSLCLLAVCFSLPSEADAGEQSGLFHRASCTVVRYYVAKYTAPVVLSPATPCKTGTGFPCVVKLLALKTIA